MFWRTVGRLLLIPIAFVLAALASAAVAVTLGLEKITHATTGKADGAETIEAYLGIMFQGWEMLAGLSILPALALVIVGEVARIRSWLYYMVGGGLALASVPLLAQISKGGAAAATAPPATLWQVLATAGFVGGLVYWGLAGRRA